MILNRRARVALVALPALSVAVTGCGADDAPTDDTGASSPMPIVATTSIWADITSATLCGIEVHPMIPAGADAHTFEPSLRDRERLENADLVIANGGGLEGRLTDLLDTVAAGDTNLVEMTPWIDTIAPTDDHQPDDDHGHDDETHDDETHGDETHDDETHDDETHDAAGDDPHGHGADVDPHVWQDPRRVSAALDVIGSAASALDIDVCVEPYREELAALDDEIVGLLADIPDADRVLVTSHDSLRYFADRYDFEIVGTVIPAANTLAETNAADLADLAERIEQRNVRAIFTDAFASSSDANALAERMGVQVVPLVTDALTDDPATDTYIEMMRANAEAIAGALTP